MNGPAMVPMPTVCSLDHMVASADATATQAGIRTLASGGNAVDAAIATNAVLAVTAPHLCGMGGDLFALVHVPGHARPFVLDASGRAGSGADPDQLRAAGHHDMPFKHDIASVTIPGCVDGWLALHARFGGLGLDQVLAPAIAYAESGFACSPLLAASVASNLRPRPAPGADELVAQAHAAGDLVRRPGVALALRAIVAEGRSGFYGGPFGAGLVALGAGQYSVEDLARPLADWVEPIGLPAWGRTVWSVPPTSQGYLTVSSAWMAAQLDLPDDPTDARWPHLLIEAALAAGHDRPDVLFDGADPSALLSVSRLGPRLRAIDPDRASRPAIGAADGDTTYLCAVDRDRMGVSLIQSNASGFGSHLFEPSTGINLHNRGLGFSLQPGHPAELAPGRRPPHTLAPALVTGPDGTLELVLGTQGGDAQPQILLQLLARLLGLGESPARAVGSRRWVLTGAATGFDTWRAAGGPVVSVEAGAPRDWFDGLQQRGHDVRSGRAFDHSFGHAQVIQLDPRGVLLGAADPRAVIGSAAGI